MYDLSARWRHWLMTYPPGRHLTFDLDLVTCPLTFHRWNSASSRAARRAPRQACLDKHLLYYLQSKQSADLFNVAHFRAKTKTTRILMRELLFADDSALVAHSAEEMQKIVDAFSDASKKFGLKINIKKTEVLYQSNSTRTREEDIMVDGNKLNSVVEFTYLGSTIWMHSRRNTEEDGQG